MPATRQIGVPGQISIDQPTAQPSTNFRGRIPPPQEAAPEPVDDYNQMVEMMKLAHESGDVESAMRISEMIDKRKYKESQSDLVSAGMGFSEGSTLGFGKNIAAGIRGGLEQYIDPFMFATEQSIRSAFGDEDQPRQWAEKSFGELVDERYTDFWAGKDYRQRYDQALATSKGMLKTARREDPYATFGGEMLGAAGLTAAPATALARGSGLIKGAGKLTAAGTVEGGLAGYGYSEADPMAAMMTEGREEEVAQQVQEAAVDAGIGMSIGAGTSLLLPLAASTARGIARTITAPFTKQAKLNEVGRREIATALAEDLRTGNMTLQQAKDELANTPGMTAADLGPAMQELTETLVNRPTEGARQMATFLRGRNIDQWKRLHPRLAEALTGNRQSNFYKARTNLLEDMRVRADNAYETAYEIPVRISNPMKDIVKQKEFKAALKTANRLRRLDGKDPLPKIKAGAMMSTREVDQIIQGMDDAVSTAWKDAPAVAKRLKPMRNDFRQAVYDQNPAFAQARQQWGNDKLTDEAMNKGLRIFNDDADLVAEVVREMGEAERTHFKIGALQAITRKLGNKVETADLSKDLWNKPNSQQALRVAFGNKAKFDDFMDYIGQEQKMYHTFYQAVGNSRTAKLLAQQQTAQGGGLAYALGYLGSMQLMPNMPMGLAGALSRRGYEAIADPSAAQVAAMQQQSRSMADMMTGTNLDQIMQPQTVGGLLDTGIPMTGATGTSGLLGTGMTQPGVDYGEF